MKTCHELEDGTGRSAAFAPAGAPTYDLARQAVSALPGPQRAHFSTGTQHPSPSAAPHPRPDAPVGAPAGANHPPGNSTATHEPTAPCRSAGRREAAGAERPSPADRPDSDAFKLWRRVAELAPHEPRLRPLPSPRRRHRRHQRALRPGRGAGCCSDAAALTALRRARGPRGGVAGLARGHPHPAARLRRLRHRHPDRRGCGGDDQSPLALLHRRAARRARPAPTHRGERLHRARTRAACTRRRRPGPRRRR